MHPVLLVFFPLRFSTAESAGQPRSSRKQEKEKAAQATREPTSAGRRGFVRWETLLVWLFIHTLHGELAQVDVATKLLLCMVDRGRLYINPQFFGQGDCPRIINYINGDTP